MCRSFLCIFPFVNINLPFKNAQKDFNLIEVTQTSRPLHQRSVLVFFVECDVLSYIEIIFFLKGFNIFMRLAPRVPSENVCLTITSSKNCYVYTTSSSTIPPLNITPLLTFATWFCIYYVVPLDTTKAKRNKSVRKTHSLIIYLLIRCTNHRG